MFWVFYILNPQYYISSGQTPTYTKHEKSNGQRQYNEITIHKKKMLDTAGEIRKTKCAIGATVADSFTNFRKSFIFANLYLYQVKKYSYVAKHLFYLSFFLIFYHMDTSELLK
jgi:hypothetical protein